MIVCLFYRTTTVYLADRRYDMLPPILSSDLCSLISEQDRFVIIIIPLSVKPFLKKSFFHLIM